MSKNQITAFTYNNIIQVFVFSGITVRCATFTLN